MPDIPSSLWHPFTQHALMPRAVHINRALGASLYAHEDGRERRIIDGISSWWVITHGHCHPHIVQAVRAQAETLDQVIFAGFTHDAAEDLAQRLVALSGDDLTHVFYSDSGSTAVEVALKMAIGYWEHTGHTRRKIIALGGGYHGDTFGAMSAGGRGVYSRMYEPYLFEVTHIPCPEAGKESETLENLQRVLKENPDDVAAFIFEPLVQGAGGMRIYAPALLKQMVQMCRAYGVLLIADEVMTGFGRTGTLFACEQAGIVPDLMCLSKGLTGGFLPMGATLCTRDIYQAFYHPDRAKMFFHSSSFTGNPLACAAAKASLEIWEREPVFERIAKIAHHHESAAKAFSKRHDLSNIRQIGTILAMDVRADTQGYLSKIQPKLYDAFLSQNLLLRPLGNTVYILPPYCITRDELEALYDGIMLTLDSFGDERA